MLLQANDGERRFRKWLAQYLALRTIWRRDPVLYVRQRLGMRPTTQQRDLIAAIAPPGAKVTCRAGHGTGKSTGVSAIIWWFLECHEFSRSICTAPTSDQLEKGLWPEAGKWLRKSDAEMQAQGVPQRFWLSSLFDVTATQILERTHGKEWMAFARTVRKGRPEGIQGQHASDIEISEDGKTIARIGDGTSILVVVDEASGVEGEVHEALEGALSSPDARELLIGNPTRRTGFFAESHGINRSRYTALHFSCADSPLVDKSYREGLVRQYGDHPASRSFRRGDAKSRNTRSLIGRNRPAP